MADVLSKTGLVERSGQGVDNIYLATISEGKPEPDCSKTDNFCVTLILSSAIEDMAFAQYIKSIQDNLPEGSKLTVYDVITLNTIRKTKQRDKLDKQIVSKLISKGYIEQRGKTSGTFYILSRDYYELAGRMTEYSDMLEWNDEHIVSILTSFLKANKTAKMGDFATLFSGHLSRKQIRITIDKLVEAGDIIYEGKGKYRTYSLASSSKGQRNNTFSSKHYGRTFYCKISEQGLQAYKHR